VPPLDPELEPWLRLSLAPGLGTATLTRLLLAFGSPSAVLRASRGEFGARVPAEAATAVRAGPPPGALDRVSAWLEDPANAVVTLADEAYPQALLQISDPPPLLYVKGRSALLNRPALAIVGSRNATEQGRAHAEAFARALSDAGLTIVSGLALGIDAAAHRGGLAGAASSIAILGTGPDTVYPARNRALALALARDGVLATEFPLGTAPAAANFPRRNRLISGLARGCLVVEAALSSGSLITARLANEQGKEVFAIPGSIHSPLAKGCHALIRQGAKLVESAQHILEELRLPAPASASASETRPLEPDVRSLLDHVGFEPCDMDTLAARTGERAEALAALLTQLELEGLVEALPGGRYQRVR
jgi:DNA processing protein